MGKNPAHEGYVGSAQAECEAPTARRSLVDPHRLARHLLAEAEGLEHLHRAPKRIATRNIVIQFP